MMEEYYELDMSPDEATAAAKLPADITGGAHQLNDYMELPCDKLIPYQDKRNSDFLPWPEEKFRELVDSIRTFGVLDAINVRPAQNKPGFYEILEGEHRWKACLEVGLKAIPAHVVRNCTDHMAQTYFSVTNLLRRENTIRDEINGWWFYTEAIRYKRGNEIDKMIENGLLTEEFRRENLAISERQMYRLAKLHDLIEPFIVMLEKNLWSVAIAEPIAYLPQDKQAFLEPYKDLIRNAETAAKLRSLAKGQLDGLEWGKAAIETLLTNKPAVTSDTQKEFRRAASQATSIVKARISPEFYSSTKLILSEALDLYFAKHPEAERKKEKKS
jgi:hypothetical protein